MANHVSKCSRLPLQALWIRLTPQWQTARKHIFVRKVMYEMWAILMGRSGVVFICLVQYDVDNSTGKENIYGYSFTQHQTWLHPWVAGRYTCACICITLYVAELTSGCGNGSDSDIVITKNQVSHDTQLCLELIGASLAKLGCRQAAFQSKELCSTTPPSPPQTHTQTHPQM